LGSYLEASRDRRIAEEGTKTAFALSAKSLGAKRLGAKSSRGGIIVFHETVYWHLNMK